MCIPKSISNTAQEDTPLFRVRAAIVSKIVEGTVITISAGFSLVFFLVIVNMFSLMNTTNTGASIGGISLGLAGGFFSQANVIMYVVIEALFLALVLFATWIAVRRKNYT